MEVRNCKGCGRLFNYLNGQPLCQACKEALEEKFAEVKEYIYQNPKASITMVAEATEVSGKQIKQWIREDRPVLSEPSPDGVLCENCGTPICSGRYCDACKNRMANNLNSVLSRPTAPTPERKRERDGNKMRFLS